MSELELAEDVLTSIAVLKLMDYVNDQIEWECANARASGADKAFVHITYNAYKQYLISAMGINYYRYVSFFRQVWMEMAEEVIYWVYEGTQLQRYPDRYGLFRYTFKVDCKYLRNLGIIK